MKILLKAGNKNKSYLRYDSHVFGVPVMAQDSDRNNLICLFQIVLNILTAIHSQWRSSKKFSYWSYCVRKAEYFFANQDHAV